MVSQDQRLRETLKWLAGPADRTGVWANIEARAGTEQWNIGSRDATDTQYRASAGPRKLNRHVLIYACVAVILVVAAAVGSLEAVKYLAKDEPILVITDDTLEPAPTGQTTQTTQMTVTGASSWQASLAAGDDKALFEKELAVFTNQDVAGAQAIFAEDASLYWNTAGTAGSAFVTAGIDEISALVADYPAGVHLYGDTVYTVNLSADKDIQDLTVAYKGARFIYAPVVVGRDLYMCVLEIRDGRIQNQYVMAMF